MSTHPDDEIYPTEQPIEFIGVVGGQMSPSRYGLRGGMTKRELFMLEFMKSTVMATGNASPWHMEEDIAREHAKAAAILTKALINELNKEEVKNESSIPKPRAD